MIQLRIPVGEKPEDSGNSKNLLFKLALNAEQLVPNNTLFSYDAMDSGLARVAVFEARRLLNRSKSRYQIYTWQKHEACVLTERMSFDETRYFGNNNILSQYPPKSQLLIARLMTLRCVDEDSYVLSSSFPEPQTRILSCLSKFIETPVSSNELEKSLGWNLTNCNSDQRTAEEDLKIKTRLTFHMSKTRRVLKREFGEKYSISHKNDFGFALMINE